MPDGTVTLAIVAKNLTSAELSQVNAALKDLQLQTKQLNLNLAPTTGTSSKLFDSLEHGQFSIRRLTSSMSFFAVQASGMNEHVARLAEGMLLFGGGHGVVLGAVVAVTALAVGLKYLTGGMSEQAKATQELDKYYDHLAQTQEKVRNHTADIQDLQEEVAKASKAVAEATDAQRSYGTAVDGSAASDLALNFAGFDLHEGFVNLKAAIDRLAAAHAALDKAAAANVLSIKEQIIALKFGQDAAHLWKLEQDGVSPALRQVTADLLDQKSMLEAHAKVVEEDKKKQEEFDTAMEHLGAEGLKGLNGAIEHSIKLFEALKKAQELAQGGLVAPLKELITAPVQPFGGALPGTEDINRQVDAVLAATAPMLERMNMLEDAATFTAKGFDQLFTSIIGGSKQSAAQFLRHMAAMAAVEAVHELAAGIGALAFGVFPGFPNAHAAAAMHFKSAALFGALGAGFAIGGGIAAGAGGGHTGGLGTGDLSTFSNTLPAKGSATVVIKGSAATDYALVDTIAAAFKELGDRNITVVTDPSQA